MDEKRPNPDSILTRIANEERKNKQGHLRLFFGMAAGVGKTCAMLKAAGERHKEGIDVQIGFVETHNRAETVKLTEGLPLLPRKKIEYKGTLQEEMDLDAILAARPAIVLVDELAHTNVPGSRHGKRYQDVIEILEAGIDVYSTMNVQHLESRADVVRLITAVEIRETVPDKVLDLVDRIDLIDITPADLIDRLKEGKIYPGRKTEQALQYFFQEGNLSALREIALRVTADKVERDMRVPFPHSEKSGRLVVAVGHSPFSEKLIRTARRIVEDLEMPWVAVHVETGKVLSPSDQNQLVKNLDLAREMGAETVTLHGSDVSEAVTEYIKEHKVIQLILGRPNQREKWGMRPSRFIERLIRMNPEVDVTVLSQPEDASKTQLKREFTPKPQLKDFIVALFWVSVTGGINYLLADSLGYRAIGFLFLLLVVVLSLFLPFAPVLTAAALSALLWDFFFIPPQGTFAVNTPEDIMMLVAYFVIASTSGFLTFQLKKNQKILKEREEKTRALYDILKSMTLVQGTKPLVDLALVKIESLFEAECGVVLGHDGKLSDQADFGKLPLTPNDLAVASWSYVNGRKAGWSTDTLPLSKVFCLALKSGERKFGVLVLKPKVDKKLNPEQESLLISIANQIGIVLAKERHDEDLRQAQLFKESEKLHQTLLNCLSHEIRTPLTAIMGAATALQSQVKEEKPSISLMAAEIVSASEKLNHTFANILDLTRIEAGAMKLKQEWFDLAELVPFLLERLKKPLADHPVKVVTPDNPLYVLGDFDLLAHALSNLLLNAASYSPAGSEIAITVKKGDKEGVIEVADCGPGIPEKDFPHLFDKFYRLPGSTAGGLGLGLSITRNLIELHGGRVDVASPAASGSIFSVILPYTEPPAEVNGAHS